MNWEALRTTLKLASLTSAILLFISLPLSYWVAFAYWKTNGTAATPVVSPSATDIWRITTYLRLAKAGHTVETVGAAYVRSL